MATSCVCASTKLNRCSWPRQKTTMLRLVVCLFVCLINWLIDWLIGWLVGCCCPFFVFLFFRLFAHHHNADFPAVVHDTVQETAQDIQNARACEPRRHIAYLQPRLVRWRSGSPGCRPQGWWSFTWRVCAPANIHVWMYGHTCTQVYTGTLDTYTHKTHNIAF